MFDLLQNILMASLRIFNDAAIYILFGLVIAAILKMYLHAENSISFFRKGRFRSVFLASLLGVPIPL